MASGLAAWPEPRIRASYWRAIVVVIVERERKGVRGMGLIGNDNRIGLIEMVRVRRQVSMQQAFFTGLGELLEVEVGSSLFQA